jgi:hypothetical protein
VAERWHSIRTGPTATFYIDLKSADFSKTDQMGVWIKQMNGSLDDGGPYTLDQYQINCGLRQVKSISTATYNKGG